MGEPHIRFRFENVCVSMYGRTAYENAINIGVQIRSDAPRDPHKIYSFSHIRGDAFDMVVA